MVIIFKADILQSSMLIPVARSLPCQNVPGAGSRRKEKSVVWSAGIGRSTKSGCKYLLDHLCLEAVRPRMSQ